MTETNDKLKNSAPWRDRPADPSVIRDLYRAGMLGAKARDAALAELRPPRAWWIWAERLMLLVGTALILAGIVYFFAYNWEKMSRFVKFGLIQTGIVFCIAGAHWTKDRPPVQKVFLLSAGVLVGPLLAVYGQAYQTGADAFELFTLWAALMVVWVLCGRFAGFWILWIGVVNTAVILYWLQVIDPNRIVLHVEVLFIALAMINAWALGGREAGASAGRDWLAGRWHRWLLLLAVLFWLTVPTLMFIDDPGRRQTPGALSTGLWAAAVAAAWLFYRFKFKDLPSLALITLSICVVVLSLIGKILFENSSETVAYLVFGVIIVAVASLATVWLRGTGRKIAEDSRA